MVPNSFRQKRLPCRSVSDCSRLLNCLYRRQSENIRLSGTGSLISLCHINVTNFAISHILKSSFYFSIQILRVMVTSIHAVQRTGILLVLIYKGSGYVTRIKTWHLFMFLSLLTDVLFIGPLSVCNNGIM